MKQLKYELTLKKQVQYEFGRQRERLLEAQKKSTNKGTEAVPWKSGIWTGNWSVDLRYIYQEIYGK